MVTSVMGSPEAMVQASDAPGTLETQTLPRRAARQGSSPSGEVAAGGWPARPQPQTATPSLSRLRAITSRWISEAPS